MEEIFQDINMHMLETKCTLNLGQLLKIALDLKWYLWQKMKSIKNTRVLELVLDNTSIGINGTTLETIFVVVTIDNPMVVIQVHVGKNTIEDVMLDGVSKVNIIIEQLCGKLGLPKP
jgi:hypothetical protein